MQTGVRRGLSRACPPVVARRSATESPPVLRNSWAKEWFTKELTGTEANGVTIAAVTDVEGDAELGMRKSKLVTIYDQKVRLRSERARVGRRTTELTPSSRGYRSR